MTVSELMNLLRDMPQNHPVVIRGYERGVDDVALVEEVEVDLNANDEWYYGRHEIASNVDDKSVPAVYLSAAKKR